MLPQAGLQELVGQVVPRDDADDLGQEETQVTCRRKPMARAAGPVCLSQAVEGDRTGAWTVQGQT